MVAGYQTTLCCSVAKSCPTPCDPMDQGPPTFTITQNLLRFMSIQSVMLSNHLILRCPLLLSPAVFPNIRSFPMSHIGCPKYWNFSFNISPSNEYSGLISFWMDWFDCLPVQGPLKSLLQHHSSKASISLVLIFLYDPTFTSVHDYWKSHSFNYMDLCR